MFYYGNWKALQYAEKRMFAPILLSCAEHGEILVHLHHAGINVEVFFFREAADRLQGRERLEAELGQDISGCTNISSPGSWKKKIP